MLNQPPANVDLEIKKINRTRIYQRFLTGLPLTKQQLTYELQLSIPTVANNIRDFLDAGLIVQSGSKGNTGGRSAVTYTLARSARVALGVDITQHHIVIAVLDLLGDILDCKRYKKTFLDCEEYYAELGGMIREHIANAGLSGEQILGVGIGLPVLIDKDRKDVIFNKVIDLGPSVYESLTAHIPYPVELFNDANAAAFTEIWRNQDMENSVYLMLGNNIGGCLVFGGSIYPGITQKAGEIGHMTLVPGGRQCYCGQRGCVDPYLSALNLAGMTGGNLAEFFRLLAAGDEEVSARWVQYVEDLVLTVHSVHALLDCPVILGGYVGEYIAPYLDDIRRRVRALDTFDAPADYVRASSYRKEAVAAGAALSFIAAFNQSI